MQAYSEEPEVVVLQLLFTLEWRPYIEVRLHEEFLVEAKRPLVVTEVEEIESVSMPHLVEHHTAYLPVKLGVDHDDAPHPVH